jgi:hypothetical protein
MSLVGVFAREVPFPDLPRLVFSGTLPPLPAAYPTLSATMGPAHLTAQPTPKRAREPE